MELNYKLNMDQLLFISIIITALNIFIIVYSYSLSFFPKKWRKKIDQDTLVGLALIFRDNGNNVFVDYLSLL